MDNKTLALVSYFTIIGWIISFFSYKAKNSFVTYHLKQSFGLFLAYLVYWFLAAIVITIFAIISLNLGKIIDKISYFGYLVFFVLLIIGIINAYKEEERPLPIIGWVFENKFNFI